MSGKTGEGFLHVYTRLTWPGMPLPLTLSSLPTPSPSPLPSPPPSAPSVFGSEGGRRRRADVQSFTPASV